jgi:hypothetical protein
MADQPGLSPPGLLSRWLVGIGLVSWRYLWSTTPLHRSERHADAPSAPPDLPAGFAVDGVQPWTSGVGPLFHRLFRVRIRDADRDAAALMEAVTTDFGRLMPQEVVQVRAGDAAGRRLRPGDDVVVDLPGPWNGPVRVVNADRRRLHLATLDGHLEAGQIEFRARDEDRELVFEIESWARAANRVVGLLYAHLRIAKEVQLNMWVRFALAAVRESGGRAVGGVEVRTVVVARHDDRPRPRPRGRGW